MSVGWLITGSKRGRTRRKKGMSSVGRQLIKASLEFTTTGRGRLPTNEANQRSKLHLGYRYSRQAAAVDRREEAAYHVRSAFVPSRWPQKPSERKSRCRIAQEERALRRPTGDGPAWPSARETTLSAPYLDSPTVPEISVGSPPGPSRQETSNTHLIA